MSSSSNAEVVGEREDLAIRASHWNERARVKELS
jgi:hypothetical protein